VSRLAPRGGDQRARAAVVAVLAEVDALPGAERETAVADRQRQGRPQQRRLDVGGHVVVALESVGPVRGPFGNRAIEPGLEVMPHFRRGVLAQGQRGRGVLDQQMQDPDADPIELGKRVEHLGGDQMKATRARLQLDRPLNPHDPAQTTLGA
jgi:hypothetical protein